MRTGIVSRMPFNANPAMRSPRQALPQCSIAIANTVIAARTGIQNRCKRTPVPD